MRDLPEGTITLLFTDIEGSTHLLQQLGERYAELLTECRNLLSAAFHTYSGHEVDTQGDAMFFVFAHANDALLAAVDAQRELASHSWPDDVAVRVRMGLHTGEPSRLDEGYVGLDVHYAARIMSSAYGGQVLLSHTTRDLVEHDLPEGAGLRNLGEHYLKDLERPISLSQLVIEGLAADFQPLKTLDNRFDSLPVQPTPLIGREHEVATLGQLLRREDVHLVTLTGPGGTGKTRLAIQTASELRDIFVDGICLVSLAPINDPMLVIPTIARALGIRDGVGQPISARLAEVLLRKQMLLLLDNFEQVVGAASQVADLLTSCPQLKLLVTSREVLHVRAEHEFAVPPLALPDLTQLPGLAALAYVSSVALFLQRAQAAGSEFRLTSTNARAVAEICVRLDGLPLAIELAAARMKMLSPRVLLARLSRRLAFIQSNYDQGETLAQESLTLFRKLGDRRGIALSLDRLGMAAWRRGDFPAARILLEEDLPLFQEIDDKDRVAWSLFTLGLLNNKQGEYSRAYTLIEEGLTFFRALGNKRGIAASLTQLAGTLFVSQGNQTMLYPLLKEGLSLDREVGDKEGMAVASLLLGWVALKQGDVATARSCMEESLVFYREMEHREGIAEALSLLGKIEATLGDYAVARTLYEDSLTMAQEIGDKELIASGLEGLASVVAMQGESAWATRLWGTSEALREAIGAPLQPVEQADYDHAVATVRSDLGEETFARIWAEGRTMKAEQVLATEAQAIRPHPSQQNPHLSK